MTKLARALKWSFLAELLSRVSQPATFIALTAILNPTDYGIVAAAMMVITFTQIFWEAGVSKALIQTSENIDIAAQTAFSINVLLGACTTAALIAFAPTIAANIFHDSRITSPIQALAIQVILSSINSTPTAILQKQMAFRDIFLNRIAQSLIPSVTSILLALNGFGYWSLIVGTLLGTTGQTIVLWRRIQWRPTFSMNIETARNLLKFGFWVSFSSLLTWFFMWADSLVIANRLSNLELGIYRTGSQASGMIFSLIVSPILPVIYSHLAKYNKSKDLIGDALQKIVLTMSLICLPIGFTFYFFGLPVEQYLPEKWKGIGYVLSALGLMQGFSSIVSANGEAYRATGKPKYETLVNTCMLAIYLPTYLYAINFGFETFLKYRVALALLALAAHFGLAANVFNWKVSSLVVKIAKIFCISAISFFVGLQTSLLLDLGLVGLLMGILTGAIIYVILAVTIERKIIANTFSIITSR